MKSTTRRARESLAALMLLAPCLPGCAGADVDWNPFYVGRVHLTERGRDARTLAGGPIWDDARGPDGRETAFHPLWRRVESATATEVQILDPLFNFRWTNDEFTQRFLALAWSRRHRSSSTESDYDFMFFPLLFFGHGDTPDENYFALFPLAGQIESFAGFAEVGFVLFPLYYYARKEITSPETFHSVTPFVGWVNGGPRDGSVHVLPLFGHWQYAGKYDKWSFLWPIFHYQHNRLDTSDPSTDVTVWPLFGIETSERMRFLTFLWPFFRFRTERVSRLDDQGVEHDDVESHQDFLWPLFRREHTRDHDYVRLWPFYSRWRSDELDSDAWMVPFFWKRTTREKPWTKETFDFVPLIHWEQKDWKPSKEATAGTSARAPDTAFKLWPLLSVKHEAGASDVKLLALLPLDVEQYTADFEANWSPFWELWHTHDAADGSSRGNALFRLLDWETYDERSRFSVPILYSGDYRAQRTTHDLLFGMIRIGSGEGGLELKLLGMPLVTPEVRTR